MNFKYTCCIYSIEFVGFVMRNKLFFLIQHSVYSENIIPTKEKVITTARHSLTNCVTWSHLPFLATNHLLVI